MAFPRLDGGLVIEQNDSRADDWQALLHRLGGDDCLGPAIVDDKGDALPRVSGIERYISASGLENRQDGNHHGDRAIHENADKTLRFDSDVLETLRQRIDPLLELTVRELHTAGDKRRRFRSARHLLVQKHRYRASRRFIERIGQESEPHTTGF